MLLLHLMLWPFRYLREVVLVLDAKLICMYQMIFLTLWETNYTQNSRVEEGIHSILVKKRTSIRLKCTLKAFAPSFLTTASPGAHCFFSYFLNSREMAHWRWAAHIISRCLPMRNWKRGRRQHGMETSDYKGSQAVLRNVASIKYACIVKKPTWQ